MSATLSSIFVSHSSRDGVAAAELRERLVAEGHRSVFLDFDPADGIPAGRSWEQELYDAALACADGTARILDLERGTAVPFE